MILPLLAAFATAASEVPDLRALPPEQAVERLAGDSSEGSAFLRAEALLRAGRLPEALEAAQGFQSVFAGSQLEARALLLESWTLLLEGEQARGCQILSEVAAGTDSGAALQARATLRDWIRSGHLDTSAILELPYLWPGIDDTTLRAASAAVAPGELVAMLPLTGSYAQIGRRVAEGARLAALDAKAGFVVVDEPADPIQAALLVRGILRVSRPRALVGPLLSNTATAAALEMARSAPGIPMVLPAATSPGVASLDPSAWQINITTREQGVAAADLARNCLQSPEAFQLWPKTEFGEAVSDGFRREFSRTGGHVAWQRSYQAGNTDFRPLLESLRQTALDLERRRGHDTANLSPVVFVPSESPSEALALGAQASQMGMKIRWIGASGWHSRQFLLETSGRLDGAYIVTDNIPDDSRPAWKAFVQRWRASENDAPDRLAGLGWDAVEIALQPMVPSLHEGAQAELRMDFHARVNTAVGLLRVDRGAFVPANCPGP
ncbi:MAG TPA: ABC transporter substrate-binding protein [Fibrobacteria bacterium]|nr:ABC transporter substrate-binding protein [Fibrobacteria bacterium]